MIEIRADGTIPGEDKYGRVYKMIDQDTGEIFYNYWRSDLPEGDAGSNKMIESYKQFAGYLTSIIDVKNAENETNRLNRLPKQYVETDKTRLVKRVRARIANLDDRDINGITVIQDMAEMLLDIEGRHQRSALPGWQKR